MDGKEMAMAEDDIQAELLAMQRQVEAQIEVADRIGETHLAAILSEVHACLEKLLKR
jgi:hypothetical protein